MLRRRGLSICLALALVGALVAPGQAAGQAGGKVAVAGGVVYHNELIPAGATVSFRVSCPVNFFPTTGTVSSADPKVLLLLSRNLGGGSFAWSFAFRNSDTKDQTVTVAVTCVAVAPIFVPPAGGLKGGKAVLVPGAGGVKKIKFRCPKGQAAIGVGAESTSAIGKKAEPYSAGSIGGIQVISVKPSGRSIAVGFRNPSPAAERVEGGARCWETKSRDGDKSRRVTTFTSARQVPAGGSVVSGGCPGAMPLLAGFTLPPDGALRFVGAGFSKGPLSASWALANDSKSSAIAQVHLLCTPGKLKFVRGLPSGATGIDTVVGPITITG